MQDGLQVSVDKLDPVQVLSIFTNLLYNGYVIPTNPWQDSWEVDVSSLPFSNFLFFSTPPPSSPEFPATINGEQKSNSNKQPAPLIYPECSIQYAKKYYRGQDDGPTVHVSMHKIIANNNTIRHLYHCQVKAKKGKVAATVTQRTVKKHVAQSRAKFVHPIVPSISKLEPNCILNVPAQRVILEFFGNNLNCQSAYLYPKSSLAASSADGFIKLSPYTQAPFIDMITRFHIPDSLASTLYFPVLEVCGLHYSFPEALVEFSDTEKYLELMSIDSPVPLPEHLHPPNSFVPITMHEAVMLGSPQTVASLSVLYRDEIPVLTFKSNTTKSDAKQTLVDLAIEAGDLRTLLYCTVWDLESRGKFDLEVRKRLDYYLSNTKIISYDGMLATIKGSEDLEEMWVGAEQSVRDAAKEVQLLQKQMVESAVSSQPQKIVQNLRESRIVVARGSVDTLEVYFTNSNTPDHLTDPITGVIYHSPVMMPSGKTVSLNVAEQFARIDIFTNKPFAADDKAIANRHLHDLVDDYIGEQAHAIIKGLSLNMEAYKQALYVMSLMRDRSDLNCVPMERREFSRIFWRNIHTLLPFVPLLKKDEIDIQFSVISRGGSFQRDAYLTMLQSDANLQIKDTLCKLFPTLRNAYDVLAIRLMMNGDEKSKETAIRVTLSFIELNKGNMLAMYAMEEEKEKLWEVLDCASRMLDRGQFNSLVSLLPLGNAALELLLSQDATTVQSVMLSKQSHEISVLRATQETTQVQLQQALTDIQELNHRIQTQQQQHKTEQDQKDSTIQELNKRVQTVSVTTQELNHTLQIQQQQYEELKEALDNSVGIVVKEGSLSVLQPQRCMLFANSSIFFCNGKCDPKHVWGGKLIGSVLYYTMSSDPCSAARHAGVISHPQGGFFTRVQKGRLGELGWPRLNRECEQENGITCLAASNSADKRLFYIKGL